MKKFGIDISKWQGNLNFDKAIAEGVEFVIVKGGGGDAGLYTDNKFSHNYKEAKKRGLPVGVYWFSKALSIEEAEKEADYFYEHCLKGKQYELPVYIDVEHRAQLALGKRALTDVVKAWLWRLQEKGYWVGIYSSKAFFGNYMYDAELVNFAHWVAQWSTKCTYQHKSCLGMWQFGGETNMIRSNMVAGQVCDQNYMLVDYPKLIKERGLNGFTAGAAISKPIQKPVEKPERTYTVKKGDSLWQIAQTMLGNGARYKEIKTLNGLKSDVIHAGQVLKLPK